MVTLVTMVTPWLLNPPPPWVAEFFVTVALASVTLPPSLYTPPPKAAVLPLTVTLERVGLPLAIYTPPPYVALVPVGPLALPAVIVKPSSTTLVGWDATVTTCTL